MQEHIHTVVQHIFQKKTLQEVGEQELQQFVADYPYATIGQLLLAEKLLQSRHSKATAQAQKTALYFHNPLWLNWQLANDHLATPSVEKSPVVRTAPVVPAAPAPVEEPPVETPAIAQEEEIVANTNEIVTDTTEEVVTAVEEPLPVPATAAPTVETPAEPGKEDLSTVEPVFEPYHTIDYFASQGIKLKLDELSKDKLGQQLKSFTEWLRGMKRIHTTAATFPTDESAQQTVQEFADHSVEGKEIVTEAMAEVWIKQGNKSRAIAIYEKLSLLNPSKKPYFATRIEQLKAN